jgi:hypothetical protein
MVKTAGGGLCRKKERDIYVLEWRVKEVQE